MLCLGEGVCVDGICTVACCSLHHIHQQWVHVALARFVCLNGCFVPVHPSLQDQRSANQLLLPDSLLTLPVVINALLKNPTLRNDADTPPDERCAYIARAMTVGTANTLQFFHPRSVLLFAMWDNRWTTWVSWSSLNCGNMDVGQHPGCRTTPWCLSHIHSPTVHSQFSAEAKCRTA